MPKAAVLTISDRSFTGTQEDVSGATAVAMLRDRLELDEVHAEIVPDEQPLIEQTLRRWVDDEGFALVITSGGTGLSPRDVTPQATLSVATYEVPGLAEVMRAASLQKTPMAALSRAVAGKAERPLPAGCCCASSPTRSCASPRGSSAARC